MTQKITQFSASDLRWACNEWMHRYIKNPEEFSREFEVVREFEAETTSGRTPSYGKVCVQYFAKLLTERASKRSRKGRAA